MYAVADSTTLSQPDNIDEDPCIAKHDVDSMRGRSAARLTAMHSIAYSL